MELTCEVKFAQDLASNESKVREKALKKVGKWLEMKSVSEDAFTEDGMLKLWKGFFFYFWNCDKPLNQEDRGDVICQYIHRFKNIEYSFLYMDTFFKSMSHEWFGIDRYRIEKFMMFVRKFLRQCLELLKALHWKLKWVKEFKKVIRKTVVNPDPESAPLGLKMHISDIYMEELARVGHKDLTEEMTMKFLPPYCNVLLKCDDVSFLKSVSKDVFLYLINQDADEKEFHRFPVLKFDAEGVQKLLIKYANKSSIRHKNMEIIYSIVKEYENYKNGVCSADKPFENKKLPPRLSKHDIEKAAYDLLKAETEISEEKKKGKKLKKNCDTDL